MEMEMHVRKVSKFIIFIKATTRAGTPVLLNYMSEDWGMSLFPNCSIPDDGGDNEAHIAHLLSTRFGIHKSQISVNPERDDSSRITIVEKETADSGKAEKYGRTAMYTFHYVTVSLLGPPAEMRREHFVLRGDSYVWRSLPDLKSDASVREKNHDVLEFLSRSFDRSLAGLPDSIPFLVDIMNPIPGPKWAAFLSHASEDKELFVRPLYDVMKKTRDIWFDEFEITPGDSLRESIDKGIVKSRAAVIVLSSSFLSRKKYWTEREVNSLSSAHENGDGFRIIPIWLKVDRASVYDFSPWLADLKAIISDGDIEQAATQLLRVI